MRVLGFPAAYAGVQNSCEGHMQSCGQILSSSGPAHLGCLETLFAHLGHAQIGLHQAEEVFF